MNWTPHREIAFPDVDRFGEINRLTSAEAKKALDRAFSECPYHWEEISNWIERKRPVRGKRPEAPPWVCPFCSKSMKWIYWQNDTPPQLLCGRGGWVEVCMKCEWWGRYLGLWES